MRVWACRAGVAELEAPITGDDWIWLVDHSNQIGQDPLPQKGRGDKTLEAKGFAESTYYFETRAKEAGRIDRYPIRLPVPYNERTITRSSNSIADEFSICEIESCS